MKRAEEKTVGTARTIQTRNTERNEKGKFTSHGGERIGNGNFVKDGENKGKQNWKCLNCKKKTVKPEKHVC